MAGQSLTTAVYVDELGEMHPRAVRISESITASIAYNLAARAANMPQWNSNSMSRWQNNATQPEAQRSRLKLTMQLREAPDGLL